MGMATDNKKRKLTDAQRRHARHLANKHADAAMEAERHGTFADIESFPEEHRADVLKCRAKQIATRQQRRDQDAEQLYRDIIAQLEDGKTEVDHKPPPIRIPLVRLAKGGSK